MAQIHSGLDKWSRNVVLAPALGLDVNQSSGLRIKPASNEKTQKTLVAIASAMQANVAPEDLHVVQILRAMAGEND